MVPKIEYRPGYTKPGEPLLIARDPVEMLFREKMWEQSTKMKLGRDFIMPPVSAYPLPIYPLNWPKGRKRWENIPPEAMWHPLLWLPKILAERLPQHYVDRYGRVVEGEESANSWAVRVLVELTSTGFYDIETGAWLDVLALHGIDIDDSRDLERISKWLAGADDKELDSIDLTEYFTYPHNPAWSPDYMTEALDVVLKAAASSYSYGTLEWLIPVRNTESEDAILDALVVACALAAEKIGPVTLDLDSGREHWVDMLNRTLQLTAADKPSLNPSLMVMSDLLEVAQAGEPYLDQLAPR